MQGFARYVVLLTGVIWLGYGIACAFEPAIIHVLTGIGIDNWAADLEVRMWYFTTELALAIVAFAGFRYPQAYLRLNLFMWMCTFASIVAFRLIGVWAYGGSFAFVVGNEQLPYSYHMGAAWAYEIPSLLLYTALWLKRDTIAPARIG